MRSIAKAQREPGFVTVNDGVLDTGSRTHDALDQEKPIETGQAPPGDGLVPRPEGVASAKLSQKRKWTLLLIFSVAQYLDVACYSGLFVITDSVLVDLNIPYESSTWIITAYSVTFAAFLPFWGRVADLYSAKPVFVWGFLSLGVINLIISFMPNPYAYFAFRALSGIAAAATIPAAFRLIPAIFEPSELVLALTLFGLSGPVANATGLIIGGFFGFIDAEGQMSGYRWFFRTVAIIITPFGLVSLVLIPKISGERANEVEAGKWKRLDLVGCFSMLISIILLILGLTLGATYGWRTPKFLVPFLLVWPLSAFFVYWEGRLPEEYALIPASLWRLPNLGLLIFLACGVYPMTAVIQLIYAERFEHTFHEPAIIAAVRVLPHAAASVIAVFAVPPIIQRSGGTRLPIAAGWIMQAVAFLLLIFASDQITHNEYWRWLFPSFIIAGVSIVLAFVGINIATMTSVTPETSGVAGALLQVALQVGCVIGLSVQAGLLTLNEGSFDNYANLRASFWFQFGWCILNFIVLIAFFREQKQRGGKENLAHAVV